MGSNSCRDTSLNHTDFPAGISAALRCSLDEVKVEQVLLTVRGDKAFRLLLQIRLAYAVSEFGNPCTFFILNFQFL